VSDVLEVLTLVVLGVTGLLCVARVVREGSLPDKVLGADTFVLVIASAVAAGVGITEEVTFLGILVVVTLLGFIGTITVARYVERRGARA
jgi:multicomponent Na+:H+ antiporter subunit F